MSSAIALFGAFETHEIRWNGDLEYPEWIAQDVAAVLGINGYRQVISRYPENYKGVTNSDGLDGKDREMLTVTEPGLYRMVFASRKPEAEGFREWVFEEVLPSIRKTGGYGVQPADPFAHPDIQQFHELLLDGDLKASEMRLLLMLRQLMAEGSFEDVTYTTLITRLGMNQSTFYRSVGLRELGIVDLRVQRMMSVSIAPSLYAVD
ncbi:MAG: hypothetical protein DCF22_18955 [Leptolyngbya sp.]|nr:MAG: hypothetical protein DCF22_18955 [Leptolyngbya sp.]